MVKYFLANWKSNKTLKDATDWFQQFKSLLNTITIKEVIGICAPFTLLYPLHEEILKSNLNISLVAQNISPYQEGQFTGEIAANMIKDLVSYVLIGHSERRNYFSENRNEINSKIKMASLANITPILCISNHEELRDSKEILLHLKSYLVLFEPLSAIGTDNAEDPNRVEEFCTEVKKTLPQSTILYGGSTSPENVKLFLSKPYIDGVVVGHNSLNPQTFFQIIKNGTEPFNAIS